jgi:hypothetical protein
MQKSLNQLQTPKSLKYSSPTTLISKYVHSGESSASGKREAKQHKHSKVYFP